MLCRVAPLTLPAHTRAFLSTTHLDGWVEVLDAAERGAASVSLCNWSHEIRREAQRGRLRVGGSAGAMEVGK